MARVPKTITERFERFVRKNGSRLLQRAETVAEITGRARDLLDVATEGAEHLARTLTRGLDAAQGGREDGREGGREGTRENPSIGVRPAPRDPRNR